MLHFPPLSTNAITQYPFRQSIEFQTFRHRFLDNNEQCFLQRRSARRQWLIDLSLLSEEEIDRIRLFAKSIRGRGVKFLFTDPETGLQYISTFAHDTLRMEQWAKCDGRTKLLVISSHE